jgi:hypothetical protein
LTVMLANSSKAAVDLQDLPLSVLGQQRAAPVKNLGYATASQQQQQSPCQPQLSSSEVVAFEGGQQPGDSDAMQQHHASRSMLQENIVTPVNTHSASRSAAADQYGFSMQQGQHTPGFSPFQLQPEVQLQQQQQQQMYAAAGGHYRTHSESSILAAQQQQYMQQPQGFPMHASQGGQPQQISAAMQPLQAPHAGYAYSAWPASASAGGACISAASSAGGAYPGQLQQQQQPAGTPLQQQGWYQLSPASACSNLSPQHLIAALPAVRAAHSTAGSISMQSTGSCSGLGLQHVLKKYRRAKALLQAHLHETQRLKAVAAGEAQKAAAAAEQARALEAQLRASTAAVAEATVAQQRLQQQVRDAAPGKLYCCSMPDASAHQGLRWFAVINWIDSLRALQSCFTHVFHSCLVWG